MRSVAALRFILHLSKKEKNEGARNARHARRVSSLHPFRGLNEPTSIDMTIPKLPACRRIRLRLCPGLLLLAALLPGINAHAGLLTEGTRLIYPANSEGRTLLIANTNPWPVLVQTWVDRGEGDLEQADAPFVVTPAIFRLEPSQTERLRIIHTGEPLPEDRESLFWLNLHEIPPSAPGTDENEARLSLTFNTQLKLLYRPAGLGPPDDLPAQLQFRLEPQDGHWCVLAHNPTPWHASISALNVDGEDGPLAADEADLLLPPFATRCYQLQDGAPIQKGGLHFSLIGDSGFSEDHHRR